MGDTLGNTFGKLLKFPERCKLPLSKNGKTPCKTCVYKAFRC